MACLKIHILISTYSGNVRSRLSPEKIFTFTILGVIFGNGNFYNPISTPISTTYKEMRKKTFVGGIWWNNPKEMIKFELIFLKQYKFGPSIFHKRLVKPTGCCYHDEIWNILSGLNKLKLLIKVPRKMPQIYAIS